MQSSGDPATTSPKKPEEPADPDHNHSTDSGTEICSVHSPRPVGPPEDIQLSPTCLAEILWSANSKTGPKTPTEHIFLFCFAQCVRRKLYDTRRILCIGCEFGSMHREHHDYCMTTLYEVLYTHFAVAATYEVSQEDVLTMFTRLTDHLKIDIIHYNSQCRLDFKCRTDWRHLVYDAIRTDFEGFPEEWSIF